MRIVGYITAFYSPFPILSHKDPSLPPLANAAPPNERVASLFDDDSHVRISEDIAVLQCPLSILTDQDTSRFSIVDIAVSDGRIAPLYNLHSLPIMAKNITVLYCSPSRVHDEKTILLPTVDLTVSDERDCRRTRNGYAGSPGRCNIAVFQYEPPTLNIDTGVFFPEESDRPRIVRPRTVAWSVCIRMQLAPLFSMMIFSPGPSPMMFSGLS